MIWRWLTCFSLFAVGAAGALIEGRITLLDSKEASVRKDSDFSGVVISLVPVNNAMALASDKHARMLQKDKTFTPHVLAIQAGTAVDFPNLDPIFHNAFSRYNGQPFDVGLYPPGTSRTIRFKQPGIVRVFCNIHPHMSAIIVVVNTPYFAETGKDGRFSIEAPPGTYELHVFHERATGATLAALTRTIVVAGNRVDVPPLRVSEAGFLPAPHKNKYDRSYPVDKDYSGMQK
jgi:plastocyanin